MKDRYFAILCASLPILNVYSTFLPGFAVGELLIFLLFVHNLLKKSFKIAIPRSLCVIYYYILFVSFLTAIHVLLCDWINVSDVIYELMSKFLILIVLTTVIINLKRDLFEKYLIKFTDYTVIFFYIQFFLAILGIRISGILPFMPLSNNVDTAVFLDMQNTMDRLSSFLFEPAHYCEYVYFALVLLLFKDTSKNIIRIVFYALSIILTKSACGFAILLTIFLISFSRQSRLKYKIYFSIATVLFLGLVVTIYPTLIESVLDRFTDIFKPINGELASVNGNSSFIRVLRGYIPFLEYSNLNKLMGYGYGTLTSWLFVHPESNYLTISQFLPTWVNTIQYVLLSSGIIGLIIFLYQFLSLYLKNTVTAKCYVLVYLVLCTCEGVFGTVLIYTLYLAYSEKYIHNENINNSSNL